MKKIIIYFLILCIFPFLISPLKVSASSRYARVEKSSSIFQEASDSMHIDNVICLAEESYFVHIIGEKDDYFRIEYNGIYGYVKKTDVKEITNKPFTPYPSNISIVVGNNCNLRSSPTTKSDSNNIIATIYSNEQDLTFIGRIFSEEAIDFGGSTWYYVNYKGNYGYIYNKYIKSISAIYPNTEKFEYLQQPIERIENPITHTPSLIIIIILFIPLLATLLLLYLPIKPKKKKLKKSPKIFDKY